MYKKYIELLKKILNGKITIKFKNPKHKHMILFDGVSIHDLKYVLSQYEHKILEVRSNRINEIFVSINFIIKFLLNIFKIYHKSKKNFVTIYFYTLLKIIKPKIVITSIDNSAKFFDLAKLLENEIKFIAVQNANRHDFANNLYRYKKQIVKKNNNIGFYLPHYFCFGQLEEELCKFYKINVKNFYKYGSIRVANFLQYVNDNKIKLNKNRYDICLISESIYGEKSYFHTNSVAEGFAQVAEYTIKFSKKHNTRFIFANRSLKNHDLYQEEIDFYKKYLDKSDFNYLIQNLNEKKFFSSYRAIFESKVAVGTQSTLLRDKIGFGEKILSCNLTNFNIGKGTYDFPLEGICSINNCSYDDFENRLLKILNTSNEDYFKQINKDKSYIMEFDDNLSVVKKIRSKIDFFLEDSRKLNFKI